MVDWNRVISVKIKQMGIRIYRIFCSFVPEYVWMYVYRGFCFVLFFNLEYIEVQGVITAVGHMKD